MHTATKAPYFTFVLPAAEPQLRIAEKNLDRGWQKFKSLTAVAPGYDSLLSAYQTFIDEAIETRQTEYRQYVQQGGSEPFSAQCWGTLLTAAVDEATQLLDQYPHGLQEKERLLHDLKRISEGCLLVLDKAFA